jgi:predicted CopG family antitoxin
MNTAAQHYCAIQALNMLPEVNEDLFIFTGDGGILKRVKLLKTIGRGSFSTVALVYDVEKGEDIKLVMRIFQANEDMCQLMMESYEDVSKVKHEGLVPTFNIFYHQKTSHVYIIEVSNYCFKA